MKESLGLFLLFVCLVSSWAAEPSQTGQESQPSVQPAEADVLVDSVVPLEVDNEEDDDDEGGDNDDSGDRNGPSYQVVNELSTEQPPGPATIAPDLPDFYVRKDGQVCLRAAFHASIVVNYATSGSETNVLQATLSVPSAANHTGDCGKSKSSLSITWGDNALAFTFSEQMSNKTKDGKKKEAVLVWAVTAIKFSFNTSDVEDFPDSSSPGIHEVSTSENERHFEAPSNFSYSCSAQDDFPLYEYRNGSKDTSAIPSATVSVWDITIEAFHLAPSGDFSQAAKCAPDVEKELPHQNIVPVAVAACLAGIILVIIVAYFFVKNRYKSPYKGLD